MAEKATTRNLIKITEDAVNKFNEGVVSSQNGILRRVNSIIRQLEVDGQDNIKPTTKNIRLIRNLREEIRPLIVNNAYKSKVDTYLRSFDKSYRELNNYFSDNKNFNPNKNVFKETLSFNIGLTQESLLQSGIDQNVIKPIIDIVNQGVTSGMSITDMEDQLRLNIIGDSQRLGGLERYTKQITRDALNQYTANYNQSITNDLGLEWYYYSGSIIEDSRSYCVERAGKYFHKNEVEDVPAQWPGRIPGTNSTNIFTLRGGYNCRHTYLAVLIDVVPKSVIDRNIANGNFTN